MAKLVKKFPYLSGVRFGYSVVVSLGVVSAVALYAMGNAKKAEDAQQTIQTSPAASVSVTPTTIASASPTLTASSTATPDPTAGWKTYTNTSTGISFRYPDQLSEGTPSTEVNYSVSFGGGAKNTDRILFVIIPKEFKKENISGVYFQNGEGVQEKTIAGRTAYYFAQGDAGYSEIVYALPSKDGKSIVQLHFGRDAFAEELDVATDAVEEVMATVEYK